MSEPGARADKHAAGGDAPASGDDVSLVRREEELELGTASHQVGSVTARKHVESEPVSEVVPRQVEQLDDVERRAAEEGDSGEVEVLPDGSVSIPILEEEVVVTKRTVVRERVIVRKRTQVEHQRVETDVRKERVEVEAEGDVELDD
jgi:uncharacterized protein (TIGR02271 family)